MAQRRKTRRSPRRTQYRTAAPAPAVLQSGDHPQASSMDDNNNTDHHHQDAEMESVDTSNGGGGGFSTPKAQRFRIPEILTCPPAPKKRRTNYSLIRRSPIAFFAPPDLELFFFIALGDVSV